MRLQTIKTRVDALSKQFNHEPAFILVQDENGNESEITADEYRERAFNGDFSLHFIRMKNGGNVEGALKVLDVIDIALLYEGKEPSVFCSEEVKKWWEARNAKKKKRH